MERVAALESVRETSGAVAVEVVAAAGGDALWQTQKIGDGDR
jgi:hypothetical protein